MLGDFKANGQIGFALYVEWDTEITPQEATRIKSLNLTVDVVSINAPNICNAMLLKYGKPRPGPTANIYDTPGLNQVKHNRHYFLRRLKGVLMQPLKVTVIVKRAHTPLVYYLERNQRKKNDRRVPHRA